MEGSFHTFKVAFVHHRRRATGAAALRDLFAHIEGYYKRQRIHSTSAYLTPGLVREPSPFGLRWCQPNRQQAIPATLGRHHAVATRSARFKMPVRSLPGA